MDGARRNEHERPWSDAFCGSGVGVEGGGPLEHVEDVGIDGVNLDFARTFTPGSSVSVLLLRSDQLANCRCRLETIQARMPAPYSRPILWVRLPVMRTVASAGATQRRTTA